MRMRRKRNLEERLAACSDILIDARTDSPNLKDVEKINKKFDSSEIFGNNNPVYLEIGCGKGQFVCEMAKKYPDINFVAVEKASNVVVSAMENTKSQNIKNVRYIISCAEYLEYYFPENSISRIFLNFSCPFPKKSYAKHRLTHENYLKMYEKFLISGSRIEMKTDNTGLFEFSLNSFLNSNFKMKNISLDLHKSDFEDNIITEYEKRFSEQGFPIYRLEAYKI